jgi:hypothetical protein
VRTEIGESVEHDSPGRRFRAHRATYGERRIIEPRSATTDGYRIEAGAEPLHVLPRSFAGDPARPTERIGDAAIQGGSELQCDERTSRLAEPVKEYRVHHRGSVFQHPDFDFDSGLAQELATASGQRIGVPHGRNDTGDSRLNDGVRARRLLPVMCTGLEGDDQRRPSSPLTRVRQCDGFRVAVTKFRVPSFAYRFTPSEHHRADEWILLNLPPTPQRQIEGTTHRLPFVHSALEAHSQAKAGEELSFGGIEVLKISAQLLIPTALIADLARQSQD